MSRRMLVNALTPEELRVAILNGNELENFQIEVTERGLTRGNIYRGIVTNVQQSLNAAFIDYGVDKHGFLPFQDIVPQQFHRERDKSPRRIEHAIEKGRPLTVQVSRDAEGQKGAALTTNISLAGRYLVFSPWDDTRGVSRKVEDETARKKLKAQLADLKIPEGAGLIARTNAVGQTKTDLKRDLTAILRTWKKIEQDAQRGSGSQLLHRDQNIVLRVMRDYVDASLDEIIIDDRSAWEAAKNYAETFMPRSNIRIQLWEERTPLFSRYEIENMIEQIHARTVPLPTGGSIVIDHTEALVAIDVNSGRNTRGSSQEETAISTNLEAARAVAKQLRLRDIGGLIVVDFIDMRGRKGRTDVVKTLREEMKSDKARSTVGTISENGLLEINRQRIQQALHLRTRRPCPTCDGSGRIASPEMIGLNLLRKIEGRAVSGSLAGVRVALHPELADAFQNGRRAQLAALETEFDIHIEIIASSRLHRPEQEIEWFERPRDASTAGLEAAARAHPQQTEAVTGDAGGRKKKRRRRKKNGAHAADEVSSAADSVPLPLGPDVDLEDDEDHAEEAGHAHPDSGAADSVSAAGAEGEVRKKRRRRRRKSGGGHHELAAGTDTVSTEPEVPVVPEAGQAPESDATSPETTAAGEGRKKRRRRRKKRGGHEQDPLLTSAEHEDLDSDDHEPLPSAWLWEEGEAQPPAGRPPAASAQPPRREITTAEASDEDEAAPARARKRSRRRRGRSSEAGLPDAATSEEHSEPAAGAPETAAGGATQDESAVASGPKRSRRRRGRSAASSADRPVETTASAGEMRQQPAAAQEVAAPTAPKRSRRTRASKSPQGTERESGAETQASQSPTTPRAPETPAPTEAPAAARKSRKQATPRRAAAAKTKASPPDGPAPDAEAAEAAEAPKRRTVRSRRKTETPVPEPPATSAGATAPKRRRSTRRKSDDTAANSQKNEE